MNCWQILGLAPTGDTSAIRRAYAQKTRTCHPEEDPEGFDRLHTAFEEAMDQARRGGVRAAAAPEAPAAPAAKLAGRTGTREECLAAEQAAYLRWLKGRKNAPAAAPAADFDFSAAEGGRPARGQEEQPEEEDPPLPPAPAAPLPPAAGESYDFDDLPRQESQARRQRALLLVGDLRAACGPDADPWQLQELLEGEEFRELMHAPEFLDVLTRLLKKEPICLDKLSVDLSYAYGLQGGEGAPPPAPDEAHAALYGLLAPLWRSHCQAAQKKSDKEAALPGRIYAVIVGLTAVITLLATLDKFSLALRLPLSLLGGAVGAAAMLLAQRLQAKGWLPSNAVLLLRVFQLFFLALFFFGIGPASAGGLLACYVAATLPGRKWYFRLQKGARFAITAACAVLALLWVPLSVLVFPEASGALDGSFGLVFSWFALPLAFVRCIVSNCRYYKLAARFGL